MVGCCCCCCCWLLLLVVVTVFAVVLVLVLVVGSEGGSPEGGKEAEAVEVNVNRNTAMQHARSIMSKNVVPCGCSGCGCGAYEE